MISKLDKNADRLQRHARVRKKVFGTSERPRFNVYRSLNHIYVQVIDDVKGVTLISASTMEKAVKDQRHEQDGRRQSRRHDRREKGVGSGRFRSRFRQGRIHLHGTREECCRRRQRRRT